MGCLEEVPENSLTQSVICYRLSLLTGYIMPTPSAAALHCQSNCAACRGFGTLRGDWHRLARARDLWHRRSRRS